MQNNSTFTSIISIEYMSIRFVVNFSPKHQLICNDYYSKGLNLSFYVFLDSETIIL